MRNHTKRLLVGVSVVAAMMLAVPAEGLAACALLDWLNGGSNAATTYAPPYAAPVAYAPAAATSSCAPCAQTVQYVPQTCYRTAYVAVPVTAYQPVVTTDPCTGCAVAAYRPVSAVTYQTRLVPYTSYRAVYANPCAPCGGYSYGYSCNPCSTPCSTCGPAGYVGPSSGCGACAGGTTTAPYTGPAAERSPTLGPTPPGTLLTPTPDGSSSKPETGPSRTFQNEDRGTTSKPGDRYPDRLPSGEKPAAERPSSAPTTGGPDLIPPDGRTAQRVAPPVTPVGMTSPRLPLAPVNRIPVIEAPWQPAVN